MIYFLGAMLIVSILCFVAGIIALSDRQKQFDLLRTAVPSAVLCMEVKRLAYLMKDVKQGGEGVNAKYAYRAIKKAFRLILRKNNCGEQLFEFERWIYENYFVLTSHSKALMHNPFRHLPHIDKMPRIYYVARHIVQLSEARLNKPTLCQYLNSFLSECALDYCEVNAFYDMLNYALIEYAATLCYRVISINKLIDRARRFKISAKKREALNGLLQFNSFCYGLKPRLSMKELDYINELCGEMDFRERVDSFLVQLTRYNELTAAAVTSIRKIGEIFVKKEMLQFCRMDTIFSTEQSGVYPKMALKTKHEYLSRAEKQARRKRLNQTAYATILVNSHEHIGHSLFKPPRGNSIQRLYVAAIFLLSLGLTFLATFWFSSVLLKVAFILAAFPIVFCLVKEAFEGLAVCVNLPSMDFTKGVPSDMATLTVICELIANKQQFLDAYKNAQTIAAANRNKNIATALLLDFAPNKEPFTEDEREIIELARDFYSKDSSVGIVIRGRKAFDGGFYFGVERKRGAIAELNRYILSGQHDFELCLLDSRNYRYAVVLDADTFTNSIRELVEIIAHPLNQEFGVVALRVAPKIHDGTTLFERVFSGKRGFDSYSFVSLNVGACFGVGNFMGKGIYDIAKFEAATEGKFKENRILSHDFIEGAFAGTANSQVLAVDGFPKSFMDFWNRQLRWTRGDWQLLPFLFRRLKNQKDRAYINPLPVYAKFHILCNLIFSLLPISSLLLIVLSLFSGKLFWFALTFAYLHFLIQIITDLFVGFAAIAYNQQLTVIIRDRLKTQAICLFLMITTPICAILNIVAIAKTLIRLLFTKKDLLVWKTFAHSAHDNDESLNSYLMLFLPQMLFALIICFCAFLFNSFWAYTVLGIAFIAAAPVAWVLSKRVRAGGISEKSCEFLRENAREIFKYFEDCLNEEYNYLVSDNYQLHGNRGFREQTSPTNIGFSLAAVTSAHHMGFLDSGKMRHYLKNILLSVATLEKYKGNLFNWYDIKTKEVLYPRYVSSVDSGNFLACLLLVRAYLRDNCSDCDEILVLINSLVDECRLEALFDESKNQFLIGYNQSAQQFSSEHYDLMASEALLTYLTAYALGVIDKEAFKELSVRHVKFKGRNVLYSWSGASFEYLMPLLFITAPKGSLYLKSAVNAAHAQVKWGKKKGLSIFGVSESQYNHLHEGVYQYKAFGVEDIAIKNSPQNDCVVSPYSSFLMLSVLPKKAIANLRKMSALKEKYGFVEAVDFTKDRRGQIVDCFMAHHLGMSLIASDNLINGDYLRKKLSEQPEFSAALMLLNQLPPTEKPKKKIRVKECRRQKDKEYSELITRQHEEPKVNALTNGRYSVVTSENGGGYSKFENMLLTYFDNSRNSGGFRIFVDKNGTVFDVCEGVSQYSSGLTRNFKSCCGLEVETNTFVLPAVDGEMRSVKIKNLYKKPQKLTVYSAVLPCLAPQNEMLSHPAFSRLFIKTEFFENCVVAYRRNKTEKTYLAHTLLGEFGYETSRYAVFGRGEQFLPMAKGRVGDVLDPVLSLNRELTIKAGESIELDFVLFAVDDKAKIAKIMSTLNGHGFVDSAKAGSRSLALSKCQGFSEEVIKRRIMSTMLYKSGMDRGDSFDSVVSVGINLNHPLLTYDFSHDIKGLMRAIDMVLDLYCHCPPFNLAIIYKEDRQYFSPIKDSIEEVLRTSGFYKRMPPDCFVFIFNESDADSAVIEGVRAASCFELSGKPTENTIYQPTEIASSQRIEAKNPTIIEDGELKLSIGKLNREGEWQADLTSVDTLTPYSNIFAGRNMGVIVTESGGGYSYYGNSRENKLSVWSNDPVLDTPSESIYIFEGANSWTATKKPIFRKGAKYGVKHGFGYSQFDCDYLGIATQQTVFLDCKKDVKYYKLSLKNNSESKRRLELCLSVDAVLGDFKAFNKRFFKKGIRENAASVVNLKNNSAVFVNSDQSRQFLSFEGGVLRNKKGAEDSGACNCINYGIVCELERGQEKTVYFSISPEFVDVDVNEAQAALKNSRDYFSALCPIRIDTPDKRLNALFNHWLPYQVICSRFNARAGFYQAGGAIGFRDQLQDCLMVMYHDPASVRRFIIEASEHQFLDGSVQHWWHPPFLGVKTKISDDMLFLPFVVAEYIAFTGDDSILRQKTAYLEDVEIPEGRDAVFTECVQSQVYGDILQHCERAIDCALRFGRNGLCLMGSGDWNDAMDKVGHDGEGESVWLSMFLCLVLSRLLKHASKQKQDTYKRIIVELKQNINLAGWDGEWYRRAFYDDGTPLGSKTNKFCRIDLISQAFAVLAEIDKERAKIAIESATNRLVDTKRRIIRLLDPPFNEGGKQTGYIQHYPEGVRENGGQYTHAAAWFIMALFRMGRADDAYSLLKMINPLEICADFEGSKRYKTEPYVLCGDVYHGADKGGRGGWSWYTGSAAWVYKVIIEEFLGLKKRGSRLYFSPNLPSAWQNCLVNYSVNGIDFEIEIVNEGKGQKITIDGISFNSDYIEVNEGLRGKRVIVKI